MIVGDIINNKYEVISIITKNEFNSIGICLNKYLENKWIIKYVTNKYLSNSNEIESLLKFNHKGIPKIIDVIKSENGQYFVMENITGYTIIEYIKIYKYSDRDILRWMLNMIEVLKHIHCYGIIHGDIKGGNIMIDDYKSLYIIDFGSSFSSEDRKSFTKKFVAPERLLDHYKVTDQSDIYSYGILFNIILNDYLNKNRFRKIIKNRNIKNIKKIIKKCIEINPKNRYGNADEIYEVLKDIIKY